VGFKVLGNKAAKLFKHETGKHVVQRCPPTENKGRRHTSTITVSILPILSSSSFTLKEQDIETKTQRGHGPGGQHQNTTDSAVRMVHKPTDTVVFINGRDQHSNKRLARQILEARVAEKIRGRQNRERSENKREQVDGGGRGNKTRTYNFLDSRVVDHILGTRTSKIKQVMKGRFDLLWK
jgi:peptide chain release factor 1